MDGSAIDKRLSFTWSGPYADGPSHVQDTSIGSLAYGRQAKKPRFYGMYWYTTLNIRGTIYDII